jgi:hypothetical protein
MAVRLSALCTSRTLPSGSSLVLISVKDRINPRVTVLLEGLGHLKKPMTSSRIEHSASTNFMLTITTKKTGIIIIQLSISLIFRK